ncbi:MAG: PPC domain-containing protein [Planctomycetes bacterium]|nr:PPC domain-containing protein [Planctomycetota bacterium]
MLQLKRALTPLAGCLLVASAAAQFPELSDVQPRGFQRGAEVELRLSGRSLEDVRGLLFDTAGLGVLSLESDGGAVVARLSVAPDCPLGLHALWVRTATGLSNLRTFSVGALPELREVEPNGTRAEAQLISLDHTVNGTADNEDLDLYAFEGSAGERVSVEIEGLRLGQTLFDPAITLFDPQGFALGSSDDSSIGRQDGAISVLLTSSGLHHVQVRESSYRGNGNCHYRLHVGRFPRPMMTLPAGGPPGAPLEVVTLGDGSGSASAEIIPDISRFNWGRTTPGVAAVHIGDAGGVSPTPVFLRASELTNTLSAEPDDTHELATRFEAPAALNGVLEAPGDVDSFRFSCKKGERWLIKVHARSLRSPIDSILSVHAAEGGELSSNDDDGGPDSRVDFTAPKDGDYVVSIRDHLGAGGPTYAYRVEVDRSKPTLRLNMQGARKSVSIPQGGRSVISIRAEREGFGGDVALALGELPQGVTATPLPVRGGTSVTSVLFEALQDAPLAETLVPLRGSGADGVKGSLREDELLVQGRNEVIFWTHTMDRLPLAVTEPAPFSVRAVEPLVPLVQSGLLNVEVIAERAEGFDGAISLALVTIPPGVTASREARIEPGQASTMISFDANSDAPVGRWPLVIAAEANIPGGRARVATQLFELEIERPFARFKVQAASVEQGSEAEMFVEVERLAGFRGSAKVRLLGLPHQVTSDELVLDETTDTLVFPLRAGPEAQAGRHRTLSFNASFSLEGGGFIQGLAAAELRVNKPAPAPKAKAKEPPKEVAKPKPEEKKERPPTRLEKLRQEHTDRLRQREGEGS